VERIKAAYDAGHQIASHSWSHKDLATLSQDEGKLTAWSSFSNLIIINQSSANCLRSLVGFVLMVKWLHDLITLLAKSRSHPKHYWSHSSVHAPTWVMSCRRCPELNLIQTAYGSYNDATVDAATQIGQDVVLWNLEYAFNILCTTRTNFEFKLSSSGDSVGAPPSESQSHYEQAVDQKLPILSLNHETHGMLWLVFALMHIMTF